MKQSVIIKSFPNGIVLHLSEADTFEEILQETAIRFRESRDFFKDAKMALSIKGRKLTEEEIADNKGNADRYVQAARAQLPQK